MSLPAAAFRVTFASRVEALELDSSFLAAQRSVAEGWGVARLVATWRGAGCGVRRAASEPRSPECAVSFGACPPISSLCDLTDWCIRTIGGESRCHISTRALRSSAIFPPFASSSPIATDMRIRRRCSINYANKITRHENKFIVHINSSIDIICTII